MDISRVVSPAGVVGHLDWSAWPLRQGRSTRPDEIVTDQGGPGRTPSQRLDIPDPGPGRRRPPERRPRRRALGPGPHRLRRATPPAARLPRRHPRHPAAPVPQHRRHHPQPETEIVARLNRRTFDLKEDGGETVVLFTHADYPETMPVVAGVGTGRARDRR